jgi:hypothetical protein
MAFKGPNNFSLMSDDGITLPYFDSDGGSITDSEVRITEWSLAQVGNDFGWSVAAAQSTLVVGAPGANKAYIYDIDATSTPNAYAYRTELTVQAGTAGAYGKSVAVGNGYIAVGDPEWQSGPTKRGRVELYRLDGTYITGWNEDTIDEKFGAEVEIASGLLYVGEPGYDAIETNQGRIYVYDLTISSTLVGVNTVYIIDNRGIENPDTDGIEPQYFGGYNHMSSATFPGKSMAAGCGRLVVGAGQGGTTNPTDSYVWIMDLRGSVIKKLTFTGGEGKIGHNNNVAGGLIFITDLVNDYIRVYDLNGKSLFNINGSSFDGTAGEDKVSCATVLGDKIYVTNPGGGAGSDGKVYIYDMEGNSLSSFEPVDTGTAEQAGYSIASSHNRLYLGSHLGNSSGGGRGSVFKYKVDENLSDHLNNVLEGYSGWYF